MSAQRNRQPSLWCIVDCILGLVVLWALLIHVEIDWLDKVTIPGSILAGWIVISLLTLWRLGRAAEWLGPLVVPAILVGLVCLLWLETDIIDKLRPPAAATATNDPPGYAEGK